MSDDVTDWFPADVKPVRAGWYEREYQVNFLQKDCDWWDGTNWFSGVRGKAEERSTLPRRWRGLNRPSTPLHDNEFALAA